MTGPSPRCVETVSQPGHCIQFARTTHARTRSNTLNIKDESCEMRALRGRAHSLHADTPPLSANLIYGTLWQRARRRRVYAFMMWPRVWDKAHTRSQQHTHTHKHLTFAYVCETVSHDKAFFLPASASHNRAERRATGDVRRGLRCCSLCRRDQTEPVSGRRSRPSLSGMQCKYY